MGIAGLATLVAAMALMAGAFILFRSHVAAASGPYAICNGRDLARERRRTRVCLGLGIAAVALSAFVARIEARRADRLDQQLAVLEARLAAPPAVAAAPAPVAPATPQVALAVEPLALAPAKAMVAAAPARALASPRQVPASAPRATPPKPEAATAIVAMERGGRLLLRDAPNGEVLGSIPAGSPLHVLEGRAAGPDGRAWRQVRSTGTKGAIQGWAAAEFIRESKPAAPERIAGI